MNEFVFKGPYFYQPRSGRSCFGVGQKKKKKKKLLMGFFTIVASMFGDF